MSSIDGIKNPDHTENTTEQAEHVKSLTAILDNVRSTYSEKGYDDSSIKADLTRRISNLSTLSPEEKQNLKEHFGITDEKKPSEDGTGDKPPFKPTDSGSTPDPVRDMGMGGREHTREYVQGDTEDDDAPKNESLQPAAKFDQRQIDIANETLEEEEKKNSKENDTEKKQKETGNLSTQEMQEIKDKLDDQKQNERPYTPPENANFGQGQNSNSELGSRQDSQEDTSTKKFSLMDLLQKGQGRGI